MNPPDFRDFVFSLQALRRRIERDALSLGGALGVAASLYPHQIANVARILGDIEVRHLLADEVGLGKTVQALMVLNALRLQRPGLRAAILVPDALMVQWRDELRSRGHVAPNDDPTLGLGERDEDAQRPTLLWPERLGDFPKVTELLRSFELLIVDELQMLDERIQRQVVSAAPDIEHILLLTATPGLKDPKNLDRLFRILEPSRASSAEEEPGQVFLLLRARELVVEERLSSGWTSADFGGPPPAHAPRATAALAHSAVRRIIRTRRDAWRRLMPYREPVVTVVEPTAAEVERQRLMGLYFGHLSSLSQEIDLPQLAQRVLRSPTSLRKRINDLRARGHERRELLQEVLSRLSPDNGDSRFDELCDILGEIWAGTPHARVLICAGDNPTVADIEDKLPRLFNAMPASGKPLRIATLRNQSRGPDSLVPNEDAIAEAVRSFRDGDSQVLIAAEVGSSGLNLQCTRHLVLYSIPWDPLEIEQWIGRIDRIGNTAVGEEGDVKPISVHVIVQRGLVDERVAEVIQATTILQRSISFDAARVAEVTASIHAAALSTATTAWPGILERARALGASQDIEELALPLTSDLPWTTAQAVALGRGLISAPPTAPTLGVIDGAGIRARERATLCWLLALKHAKEYDIRRLGEVTSMGYTDFFGGRPRHISEVARKPLDESLIPHSRALVYFQLRRDRLGQPPESTFVRSDGAGRSQQHHHLYFFDHGSPVHENLVDIWLTNGGAEDVRFALDIPAGHPLETLRGAVLVIEIATLDPRALINEATCADASRRAVEADRRFLCQQLPTALVFAGYSLKRGAPAVRIADEAVANLIAPDLEGGLLDASVTLWVAPSWLDANVQRKVATHLHADICTRSCEAWSSYMEPFRRAVEDRCYVLAAEAADAPDTPGATARVRWLRAAALAEANLATSTWRRVWCLLK